MPSRKGVSTVKALMKLLLGGKATNRDIVEKIARDQARLDGRYLRVYGSWSPGEDGEPVQALADDEAHFVIKDPRISLQISMRALDGGLLATTFPSPRVMTPDTCAAFTEFSNALNDVRVRAGLFAVDTENMDIYYQAFIPWALLRADIEKARELLLETGVKYFGTMSVPIWGLAQGDWPVEKAIRYMNEILDEGFVCDDDYD